MIGFAKYLMAIAFDPNVVSRGPVQTPTMGP